MKKVIKLFLNIRKELDWLEQRKGWKLIHTNGIRYTFVESDCDYNYEYVFFRKSKKELRLIRNQVKDCDIEFVCNSSTWAPFRKNAAKGPIRVLEEGSNHRKTLRKLHDDYIAFGLVFTTLALTAFRSDRNYYYNIPQILYYICSFLFYLQAYAYKKYSKEY